MGRFGARCSNRLDGRGHDAMMQSPSFRLPLPLTRASLAAALAVSLSGLAAHAQVESLPDPSTSLVEPVIVGGSSGLVIGDGYRVVVRDFYSHGLPGVF